MRIDLSTDSGPALPLLTPEKIGLFAQGRRIMIVARHPDDAEFFLGGTLTRAHEAGATIRLVAMTNGDKAGLNLAESYPSEKKAAR